MRPATDCRGEYLEEKIGCRESSVTMHDPGGDKVRLL